MTQAKRAATGESSGERRRRSPEEGLALVREWQASGLRPAEYCRARGIAEHGLQYWRRRSQPDERASGPGTGAFFAMMAPASASSAAAAAPVHAEICVRESVRVRVSLAAGREPFVQVLRGVLEALES